ncbi:hypothetical protein DY000_02024304 [Brassica cretica]|uniref:Uncharacterized protein n=1 Tax=Brassica cretica TaxID=69181 RepID=A0ABQ7EAG2_BRACR|nr:hypothetical protein DY000_02024304 [Brassica cretica]
MVDSGWWLAASRCSSIHLLSLLLRVSFVLLRSLYSPSSISSSNRYVVGSVSFGGLSVPIGGQVVIGVLWASSAFMVLHLLFLVGYPHSGLSLVWILACHLGVGFTFLDNFYPSRASSSESQTRFPGFGRTFFLSTGFGESPDVGLGSALARRRFDFGYRLSSLLGGVFSGGEIFSYLLQTMALSVHDPPHASG